MSTSRPYQAGSQDITVTITYTDDFNQPRSIIQTLTVDVMEAPVMETPMFPGEGGCAGGTYSPGDVSGMFSGVLSRDSWAWAVVALSPRRSALKCPPARCRFRCRLGRAAKVSGMVRSKGCASVIC